MKTPIFVNFFKGKRKHIDIYRSRYGCCVWQAIESLWDESQNEEDELRDDLLSVFGDT